MGLSIPTPTPGAIQCMGGYSGGGAVPGAYIGHISGEDRSKVTTGLSIPTPTPGEIQCMGGYRGGEAYLGEDRLKFTIWG